LEKFIKIIRAEVKEIDNDKHTLTAVVSTKKVDRDGDIIEPEAFKKRLKNYNEHPVLLSSHVYWDLRKQIGKALKVSIEDNEVVTKFEYFVGQGNEEADWAWVLAQKGVAAYSIGFMGHAFDWIKEKDAEGNERITGRKFTDIELLEISQVLVPSNRGALQSSRSFAKEQIELCELVSKSFKDEDFAPPKRKAMDDRDWVCNECGNGFTYLEGSKEFLCTCGKACVVKMRNVSPDNSVHYSNELLGKEAEAIPEPQSKELTIEDIKGAVDEAVATTKG
jgi:HK97 family phage prohead protease